MKLKLTSCFYNIEFYCLVEQGKKYDERYNDKRYNEKKQQTKQ